MRLRAVLIALLVTACTTSAGRPTLTVRNAHTLVRDSRSLIVFGGADEARVVGDTWRKRDDRWELVTTNGPSPRTFPAAAYDERRRETLLFGGLRVLFGNALTDDLALGDTWIWNGRAWRTAATNGPTARAEAAMAFDAGRGRVVLFGGYTVRGGARERLGDTWEWDGASWRRAATDGPSPRNGAAMAYDEKHRRIVLFGGRGATADTWTWDGVKWSALETNVVPGRFNSAMTYDPTRDAVLRFGGWDGKTRTNDTWLLEESTWTLVATSVPPARNHSAMAWDASRGKVVLFGGHDGERVFGDEWEWDGRAWRQVRDVEPRPRVDNGH